MAKKTIGAPAAPELIEAPEGVELMTAEQYEAQLVDQVKRQLPETYIAEFKAYADKLVIVGPNDKDGYKTVQEAITTAVKARTSLDKKRKELKAPFKKIGEAIDAEAKRLTALLEPIENDLKAKKQEVDDFIEAERQRLENEKQERFNGRVTRMTEAGVSFNGIVYHAGVLNVSPTQVMEWEDEQFETELAKLVQEVELQRAAEARKAAEAEEAKRKAEEAEAARKQAEEAAAAAEAENAALRARLAALEAAQAPAPEPIVPPIAEQVQPTEPNTFLDMDANEGAAWTPPTAPEGQAWSQPLNAFVPEADPFPQGTAAPVSIKRTKEFIDGFEECKRLIANEMESGATPRNRAEWTAWIRGVQPEMIP